MRVLGEGFALGLGQSRAERKDWTVGAWWKGSMAGMAGSDAGRECSSRLRVRAKVSEMSW
jgi:hypothetical protein